MATDNEFYNSILSKKKKPSTRDYSKYLGMINSLHTMVALEYPELNLL